MAQQRRSTAWYDHLPFTTDKSLTLADKVVFVVGLLQKKTCCCEACKWTGACRLSDPLRDDILHTFDRSITSDRLERLGTYALDFGDLKIQKMGDNSVYIRSVMIRGEQYSVIYKLIHGDNADKSIQSPGGILPGVCSSNMTRLGAGDHQHRLIRQQSHE